MVAQWVMHFGLSESSVAGFRTRDHYVIRLSNLLLVVKSKCH